MTKSFAEYKRDIAELELKMEEARRNESAEALVTIRTLMKTFDLTLGDIGAQEKKPKGERKPVDIKYKDQATGQTWTGRGRAPKWLDGKNKEDYLIRPAA
ncbi:H-NS histone family protein [Duganella vulcania]|uniref:H-NS histone family protein n=1 Tax=Duganella vulcania TaxID=2692166 RepID=A0A845GDV2_9BURK|nr:H-NS histone family protein [Duganella vulcania]MYM92803.1 H-NS histone family protein [Duganella vulcania]